MNSKESRRTFLQRGAKGVAAGICWPLFLPSGVLGRAGLISPSEQITMGFIGVGGMGTANLRTFLGYPEVRVLAVCDVDRNHRNRARDLVDQAYGAGSCAAYEDFRELLARNDIDAVSIAVPDHWHAIIAVEAARAGKDIHCEKPLAYTVREGKAVVEAVTRRGLVWQTGSWQRSQRHFRFACELVRNGYIGHVHTVRVGLPYGNSINNWQTLPQPVPAGFNYDMWLGPAPEKPYCPARCHWNFRWISDYSGGQLTDWAGHHCDIAHWGMNTERSAPVEVQGRAIFPPAGDGLFDTPESYYFEAKYAEGFTMIVADRRQQPKGMGVHFVGEEGWIHVNRAGIDAHPQSILSERIGPDKIHLYRSDDHAKNFLDCVRSRKPTVAPVDVAYHSILVAHLGNIAMKLGRPLKWDHAKERFVDDPEADRYLVRPMRPPWHLYL